MLIYAGFFMMGIALGFCIAAILSAAKCTDCRCNSDFHEMEGRRAGK